VATDIADHVPQQVMGVYGLPRLRQYVL